jgi:hypothetical protein
MAHQGNGCAAQAETITNHDEEAAFLKSCLAKDANQDNSAKVEQKEKEAYCDQNAKNMNLTSRAKQEYLLHCYHEDYTKEAIASLKLSVTN